MNMNRRAPLLLLLPILALGAGCSAIKYSPRTDLLTRDNIDEMQDQHMVRMVSLSCCSTSSGRNNVVFPPRR